MAERLTAMGEKEQHVHIAVNDLVSHPRLAQLVDLVHGKAGSHNASTMQLCQCEDGNILFMFHPVGGSMYCYSESARQLQDRYTLYAAEPAGFKAEKNALNTKLQSIQERVAIYLTEIIKVTTDSIIFCGWSFGGLRA